MELGTVFTTFLVCTLLLAYWWRRRSTVSNLPPGPFRWPILGSIPSLDLDNIVESFAQLARQYGSMVTVQLGPFTTVNLNDPVVVKEAMSRDVFLPRPDFWSVQQRQNLNDGTSGLVFTRGETWKEHRRFVLHTFRDFGVGKSAMEDRIVEETSYLIERLRKSNSEPLDNKVMLSSTIANIISIILSGRRYEEGDPALLECLVNVQTFLTGSPQRLVLDFWPWTRYLPGIKSTKDDILQKLGSINRFMVNVIQDHSQTWVPGVNKNLLDSYMLALQTGQHKTFSKKELPLILEDLFEAGFDTTTTTLRWGFLMICVNPEVQKAVQDELDQVVPHDVIPRPSDKYHLPYFEAFIQEVHRFGSIAPMGVEHCAAEDTTLGSYTIPKDCWVRTNLRYIHHNPQWWDQPEKFDPDRFLGPEGQKKAMDYLMPFSVGKRRCVGEALAKAELYTVFAAVLQNFTLVLPDGVHTADLRPLAGITADTRAHEIRYIPRR